MKQTTCLRTAALVLIAMSAIALYVVLHPVHTISKLSALGGAAPQRLAYNAFPYGASSQYQSAASDYLSLVTENGACRWTPKQMPIRVYIKDGNGTPGYRPTFKGFVCNAFDEWCRVLGQKISWHQVATPAEATVIVSWTASTQIKNGGAEAGETQAVIETNRITGEHRIQGADIFVLTELLGRPFNDADINKICLHEVGHAIGLQGHSNLPSDIMYPSVNPAQQPYLTQRDINTMQRLYADYNQTSSVAARQLPVPDSSIAQQSTDDQNAYATGFQMPGYRTGGQPGRAWRQRQGYMSNGNSNFSNPNFSYAQRRAAMRRQAWEMARRMEQEPQFSSQFGGYQQFGN